MTLLRQPYPVSEKSPGRILLTGLVAGGFVALFLIVFQPFGTASVDFPGKNWFLAGYGAIVAASIWLSILIPARLYGGDRWTVGRQLLLMLGVVLLGITASYFYLLLLGGTADLRGYGIFLANASTVAVFPIVGMTLADYWVKLRRYARGAEAFNASPVQKSVPTKVPTAAAPKIVLEDDQQRPVLTLPVNHVWALCSDRNYVDVYHLNPDGRPVKSTVRNTLTRIGTTLPDGFLRTHRSWFVRAAAVDKVTGNAQGYRLHNPEFPDTPVPVSRGKSAEILSEIRE